MQRLSDVMRLDMIMDKSAEEIKEVRTYVCAYVLHAIMGVCEWMGIIMHGCVDVCLWVCEWVCLCVAYVHVWMWMCLYAQYPPCCPCVYGCTVFI